MSTAVTKDTTKSAPRSSGLALEALGDLSSLLDKKSTPAVTEGTPIQLLVELIDEDENQPRQTFDEEEMEELKQSIAGHNVKVPISVSRHPTKQGRFILNDGARRLRAVKANEFKTIPAFIEEKYSRVEQLLVNKVRADTPPLDKAMAYQREMEEQSITQRELAIRLNVSPAYVSMHMSLLNMPTPVAEAFHNGRSSDVTLIAELNKAYKKKPEAVKGWLADPEQEITRGSVKLLREYIDAQGARQDTPPSPPKSNDAATSHPNLDVRGLAESDPDSGNEAQAPVESNGTPAGQEGGERPETSQPADKPVEADKFKKAIVLGSYKKRDARLLTTKRPSADGLAWIKYEDNGEEVEIEIGQLKLNRIMEGTV